MKLSKFDYVLPPERIAQQPPEERSAGRMLVLSRRDGRFEDSYFRKLPSLLGGDELVVVNNARVVPARLFAHRGGVRSEPPGKDARVRREYLSGRIEVLLTRRIDDNLWEALVRPGRRVGVGEQLFFEGGLLEGEIVGRGSYGVRRICLRTTDGGDVAGTIERIGHVPLPPYIRRPDNTADRERYQTVFANQPVAVAAPTAGLHFTPGILSELTAKGVEVVEITLEVGPGTFRPIRTENLEDHVLHSEAYEIPAATAASVASARRQGRPILAIGTTVVRTLEDAAQRSVAAGRPPEEIAPGRSCATLFIRPGHHFALVDQLLTNFHPPRSSPLVMVCAFAGAESVLAAYRHAVDSAYRFYSYGDCTLIR